VASSTNSSHGKRPNKGGGEERDTRYISER
jgi:hypothetical protein